MSLPLENPQPSNLNPQPSTFNPRPSNINPQTSTLNPQLSTLNPHSPMLNPQPWRGRRGGAGEPQADETMRQKVNSRNRAPKVDEAATQNNAGYVPFCRLLIVPPFRGSSRFESLILSHHSRTKLHVSVRNEVKAESRPFLNIRGRS